MRPEERIERFLEAYGGEMFSDEDAFVRDLLASDLRRVLDLVAQFRDEIAP